MPGFLGHNRLAHSGRINLRGSVGGRGTSTRASRALLLTPSLGASRAEGQLRRGGWDSWMSLPTSGLGVPQAASQSLHSGNSMGLDVCSAGGSTDSAVLLPRPEVRLPLAELLGGLGIRLVQRFQQARPLPQSRGYFRPHSGRRSGWDSLLGSIQLFRGIGGLRRRFHGSRGSGRERNGTARSTGTGLQWAASAEVEVRETSSAGAEVQHAASEGADAQGVSLVGAGR